ncbi:MAG: hypothetical protein KGJ90_05700, partial [Patescibacteria group bacterium]|nr:hypothetical protein [Patescibacteria group bacterium]
FVKHKCGFPIIKKEKVALLSHYMENKIKSIRVKFKAKLGIKPKSGDRGGENHRRLEITAFL